MMVCISNESETNSVYNWKGVCITEGLGEMKDTQIFPDFGLEYIEPLLTVKYNTMFWHG